MLRKNSCNNHFTMAIKLLVSTATVLYFVVCLSGCSKGNDSNISLSEQQSVNQSYSVNEKTDNNDVVIENEIKIEESNDKWDEILCYGDGYYVVRKTIDTYEEYSVQIGIIDENLNWIFDLSAYSNAFALAYQNTKDKLDAEGNRWQFEKNNYAYLGEGVFICSEGVRLKCLNETIDVGDDSAIGWGDGALPVYFINAKNKA